MKRILIAGIMMLLARVIFCSADPVPLPADPQVLALVNQLHQDSLYADVASLVNFHTRHTYSDTTSATQGIGAARQWLLSRFNQVGAQAQLFPWSGSWGGNPAYPCYNVHTTLAGSSTRRVIMGGHFDSRTVSSGDITGFAPGADDDGSGVAVLLETARIIAGQPLAASLVTAAFAGEEQGLLGAEAYADSLHNAGMSVTGMINLDMIGHIVHPGGLVDSMTVRCFSGGPQGSSSRQMARWVKWVGESYSGGLTVLLQNALDRPGRSGDHVPFYNNGYASCRLIETGEDVAYQHGPSDVPENMSFSYARKVARLALGAATVLARATTAPSAPVVINYGNGTGAEVSWPDSLVQPDDVLYLAYRTENQLYWENILTLSGNPPQYVGGLDSGSTYEFSLSRSIQSNALPSLFSSEAGVALIAAPAPEGFETESTPTGVQLNWHPRPEPSTLSYLVERAIPGGVFEQIASVNHPDSTWFDAGVQPWQLYQYRVRTRLSGGLLGAPSPVQEGQLASHDRGILLVDATPDGSGPPNAPTDAQVDSFYALVTGAYEVAGQWDRADSLVVGATLSDGDLAPYTIALVYADYFNGDMAADTTALRKYLNNGGKLFLSGWRLSKVLMGSIAYAQGYGPGDFIYDMAGIDSLRVAPTPQFAGTFGQAGYPDLILNTAYYPGGLLLCEATWTQSYPPGVAVVGEFNSNQGGASAWHEQPVAWKGDGVPASWVLADAPLFFMTEASALLFMHQAMADLNAPLLGISLPPAASPQAFRLHPARPNPFNATTVASFELRVASLVELTVYDTAGRIVARLVDGWREAGEHRVLFDGRRLVSGVYLVKMVAGDFKAAQKVVLLR
jgi:hypothetical protein